MKILKAFTIFIIFSLIGAFIKAIAQIEFNTNNTFIFDVILILVAVYLMKKWGVFGKKNKEKNP